MLLVPVLIGTILLGRGVTQDASHEGTTTVRLEDENTADETTTTAVDINQDEIEEEILREECLYKQKRPGFT